jgi:hypothetical protein
MHRAPTGIRTGANVLVSRILQEAQLTADRYSTIVALVM